MMKPPFVLLLVLLFASTYAQPIPVFLLQSDTSLELPLGTVHYQLTFDKKNQWTLGEVSKPPLADRFNPADIETGWADSGANTCWIRYQLKNVMQREAEIALGINGEQVDYYVLDTTGQYRHFFTGTIVERSKKDGFRTNNHIPVQLRPGQLVTVYAKIHNRTAIAVSELAPTIAGTQSLVERDYVQQLDNTDKFFTIGDLQTVYLIGLLSIAMLFSLFFYVTTREKEFGYFALVLLFLAITRFINPLDNYLAVMDPLKDEKLGYLNLAWPLSLLCQVQFVRHFFTLDKQYPTLSRFLVITAIILTGYNIICTFLDPDYLLGGSRHVDWNIPYSLLIGIINAGLLVVFFLYLRNKHREIKLVIIGGSPLIILNGGITLYSSVYYLMHQVYQLPPGYISDNVWMIELICVAWFVILFSLILFMRFNKLRKENLEHALQRTALIEGQKTELEKQVTARTIELKQSLEELQATQKQLIQQEKMASLGELTAGIAHEIQNPLNFVNNFSELNKELIAELKEAKAKQDAAKDPELESAILEDIEINSEKINEHGKRADAIVKGMLQHSRASSGKKEPTELNALCDEYLRLSYHGLRAKDKNFQANFSMELDPEIERVNCVAQDIGRVMLNLFNNAFYAVNEKRILQGENYTALVTVSTKKIAEKILVTVSDNGSGIPQTIIDKIFQPFFTTKPTGQGTGLGLSLAYDIVKAHGSELKVSTKAGEGTSFSMML